VNILLNYEFQGMVMYTKYLSVLSATEECFAISFVTPETQNNRKLLFHFLRERKQVSSSLFCPIKYLKIGSEHHKYYFQWNFSGANFSGID
jgi:hypothetical protein